MLHSFTPTFTLALIFLVSATNSLPAVHQTRSTISGAASQHSDLASSSAHLSRAASGEPSRLSASRHFEHRNVLRDIASYSYVSIRHESKDTRRSEAAEFLSDQTGTPPNGSTVFASPASQNTTAPNTSITLVPRPTSISSAHHKEASRTKSKKVTAKAHRVEKEVSKQGN
ncbi:hypothetical protein FIBSPDRAFT_123309 [Athelia psychrophila]|uniref:Uncharacterized protein n=1 Tax=Athelia psychrophila TaxID=1759441 RepID=A0A166CMY9_9AGAM|nr:hypothetical protein FIBSPDRAFT_123309 [Fibularhizoctonia sp. CBS 109695]